jgi:hypothetical protein
MTSFMETTGLHMVGFTDAQIAEIDAAIPKAAYVLAWVKNNKSVLMQLIDVSEMAFKQIESYQKENTQWASGQH